MKSEVNWEISFVERALRAQRILDQQVEITYEQAIQQIERLRRMSKVNNAAKKNRSDLHNKVEKRH